MIEELTERQGQSQAELQKMEQQLGREAAEKAALENAAAAQLASLEEKYRDLQGEYESKLGELESLEGESRDELAELERKLGEAAAERDALQQANAEQLAGLEKKYDDLQGDYENKLGELESLQGEIEEGKQKMAGLEQDYEGKLKGLEDKYQGLKGDLDKKGDELARLQGELGDARAKLEDTAESLDEAESELAATTDELKKALEMAKQRQDVAQRIKEGFNEAGIKADVDSGTGDVIIDFGDEYFETDSAQLKPGMMEVIREAMPVYAESLFGVETDAAEISAIEIIGFASPTYAGKPVNPTSLSAQNRRAVNYNLDLSYERARSIFKYAFDPKTLRFKHQETMLPLIKVTGRSFFTEQVNPEDTGNLSSSEFCERYDCYGSQRVIIKFGLQEKDKS